VTNSTDACLVFINAYATEALDRIGTHDDYSDTLVKNVASQCSNTIVVIHNAGVRLVDQFVDHPNVTAIIYGHLPGQDSGRAIVSLLYGDENFSSKLPYTVARTNPTTEMSTAIVNPLASSVAFPRAISPRVST
jgi:beta-glucosidase